MVSASLVSADDSKTEKIKQLLDATNALELGVQFASAMGAQMEAALKAVNESVPDSVFTIMYEEMNKLLAAEMSPDGEFAGEIIKIYSKYFTEKDIDEMLKFYETEVGKKTIRLMPTIMTESMTAGQEWGMSKVPELMKKVFGKLKMTGVNIPPI